MADDAKKSPGSVSRREFLKGMGTGVLSTATLTTGGLLSKETAAAILGPEAETLRGKQTIQLSVNGKLQRAQAEPRTTLLSVLRDQLDLTGTKDVCDRGQCGGCTVFIDDKLALACMTLAVDARGKKIVTVEGLGKNGQLTPVQQAFVQEDGLQCGFCTPGMVVASTALLKANANPSLEEIKLGLSGNLCRCGAYNNIFSAVRTAAKNMRKGG